MKGTGLIIRTKGRHHLACVTNNRQVTSGSLMEVTCLFAVSHVLSILLLDNLRNLYRALSKLYILLAIVLHPVAKLGL